MKIIYWLVTIAILSNRKWIHGFKEKCASYLEQWEAKKYLNRYSNRRNFNRSVFVKKNTSIKCKNIKNEKLETQKENVKTYLSCANIKSETNPDCEEIKSKALKKLYERELIHYISDIKNVDKILFLNENEKDKTKRKSVYVGFDLSCRYLHIGNLVPLKSLNIIRHYNTDVIILLGTSTTKIGDPSFQKVERRKTLDEEICENEKEIKKTILQVLLQNEIPNEELTNLIEKSNFENEKEFIYEPSKNNRSDINDTNYSNGKGSLIIVKNNLWYDHINIIDFLKYGEYFSINKLLRKECFLAKFQKKLTLKDFNYLTLQAYDFLYLFKKYNTVIQLGGSDQWGNIQSGIELCQHISNIQLFGMTTKLLLHKNNVKYSKSLFEETKKLPIWISKEKNPPFLFWNFFRNLEDEKVRYFSKMLTDVEIKAKKIRETVNTLDESDINEEKKKLADHITAYVYGEDVVRKINKIKKIGKMNYEGKIQNIEYLKVLPFIEIKKKDLEERKISIIEILKRLEIASSNKDAKNKIIQKYIYLNDNIVSSAKLYLNMQDFLEVPNGHYSILRVGRKTLYAVLVK